MSQYLARKIVFAIPTLWLALTVVFFALRVVPGDPAVMIAGDFATPAVVAQIRHEVGLDKPLAVQYGRFMSDALRGDFGRSLQFGIPVRQEILRAAPLSLELAFVSLVLAIIVGVSAGAIAAARQHTPLDSALSVGMLSGLSIPAFWLGLLLILVFGLWLHLLPISGVLSPGVTLHRITGSVLIDSLIQARFSVFRDAVLHMILPAVTLALAPAAIISRMTRSAVLDVLKDDYVRTARAKGLRERTLLRRHVLKNASIPVVTLIGLQAGYLISGAVVVETIFARPGVGWLTTQAVLFHDYPLVEGLAFFGVAVFIAINIIVDVLYWVIDPRSRLSLTSTMVAETTTTPSRMLGLTRSEMGRDWIGRFAQNRAGLLGACIVIFVIVVACIGPSVAPYPANAVDLNSTLLPPSLTHLMGTDSVGRDVFSRVLSGGRIALEVGVVSVGIAILVGIPIGLIAGYYGRAVDTVVMAGNDVLLAFPYMLLALLVVAVLGPSLGSTMIAVGVVYVPQYVRLVRGVVLSAKARDYVLAAKASGARDARIIFRHIFPNCISSITIQASLSFGSAVVAASTLSFLGLGAQPPTPEWGAMLRDGSSYMQTAPWMATFPGVMIFLTVIGFNLLGDGLRDALDPRRKS